MMATKAGRNMWLLSLIPSGLINH